jgi:hypothetical protein
VISPIDTYAGKIEIQISGIHEKINETLKEAILKALSQNHEDELYALNTQSITLG